MMRPPRLKPKRWAASRRAVLRDRVPVVLRGIVMEHCDNCDKETSFRTGTYFTGKEFVHLLRKDFSPNPVMLTLAAASGISEDELLAALPEEIRSASSSGWLLCATCASGASRLVSQPPGNRPDGEPGTRWIGLVLEEYQS